MMNEPKRKRPPFLSALCILSFVGGGLGFVGYFLVSVFFERAAKFIIKYSYYHSVEQISAFYFTALMVLFALSLIGAIRMWKLHRDGFFLYTISQISILFLPVVWMDWQAFSATNAIFTAVFVIGYGLNWKFFR